jgi:hypothetical protein
LAASAIMQLHFLQVSPGRYAAHPIRYRIGEP